MWSRLGRIVPSGLRSRTRDTWSLLRDYLLQETVDPITQLGRYVLWGTLGSFFVGVGALMLMIALLRMLHLKLEEVEQRVDTLIRDAEGVLRVRDGGDLKR